MKPWKPAALAAIVLSLTLLSAPAALAESNAVTDPSGDASGAGLDVVRARVANNDRAVVATVRFTEAVRGDLIVSLDLRRQSGVRLVSQYRPDGETRNYVVAGSFQDQGVGGAVACDGFRVTWDAAAERARLRLPSRCLQAGDYGAVRFSVLTERGGGDTDYAPGEPDAVSEWIPRG